MTFSVDLDSRDLRNAAGQTITAAIILKRRDKIPFSVKFTTGGVAQDLPEEATGKLGLKVPGEFTGGYIAFADEWSKEGQGTSAVYTFPLDLNTEELESLFAAPEGGAVPDTVPLELELEWFDGTYRQSTQEIKITVQNDLNRGDESTPAVALDLKATQAEAEAGTNNAKWMTPLRVAQALSALLPDATEDIRVVVADEAARFALTIEQAQNGDFVFQTDTGILYQVTDQTQLDSAAGYTALATVAWNAITGKPATLFPAYDLGTTGEDITPDLANGFRQYCVLNTDTILHAPTGSASPLDEFVFGIEWASGAFTFSFDASIRAAVDLSGILPVTLEAYRSYRVYLVFGGGVWTLSRIEGPFQEIVD